MNPIPFIDIHTHSDKVEKETITTRNIFPGDGFAAFTGRNFYSAGLHPWHIKSPDENNRLLMMIEDALEFDHVIMVGECGLDKLSETNYKEQRRVFEAQAFMAEEFQYPLIIHCVKAYQDVLEMHKKMDPVMPWIMHGYSGNLNLTKQFLEKDFLFSFGGNLFNEKAKVIESFKFLPLKNIFFETDELEGEVEQIYTQASLLKNIDIDFLKEAVWENFDRIEKSITNRS